MVILQRILWGSCAFLVAGTLVSACGSTSEHVPEYPEMPPVVQEPEPQRFNAVEREASSEGEVIQERPRDEQSSEAADDREDGGEEVLDEE